MHVGGISPRGRGVINSKLLTPNGSHPVQAARGPRGGDSGSQDQMSRPPSKGRPWGQFVTIVPYRPEPTTSVPMCRGRAWRGEAWLLLPILLQCTQVLADLPALPQHPLPSQHSTPATRSFPPPTWNQGTEVPAASCSPTVTVRPESDRSPTGTASAVKGRRGP